MSVRKTIPDGGRVGCELAVSDTLLAKWHVAGRATSQGIVDPKVYGKA